MAKIGFMGLGAMGSRMAAHLVAAGHELKVYNRSEAPVQALVDQGATAARTPREAAAGAEFVISMLTDDDVSRRIWLEGDAAAIQGLERGAVAIESSTVTPDFVRVLGTAVEQAGAAMVDAPLAGSRPQAEAKKLIYFVGCESAAFERALPVLNEMGGVVHHVGSVGNGSLFKLVVNSLFATQVEVLAELLGMMQRAGIAPDSAMAVLGELPVTSPAIKGVGGLIASGAYAPMFPVDLVTKDMRYAAATAKRLGAEAPTLESVGDTYTRAGEAGHGALNIHAVAKLFVSSPKRDQE